MIIWGLKSQPVIDRKKQNEQHEKSYINSGQTDKTEKLPKCRREEKELTKVRANEWRGEKTKFKLECISHSDKHQYIHFIFEDRGCIAFCPLFTLCLAEFNNYLLKKKE